MIHGQELRPQHISQGEFLACAAGSRSITTILGSCVACCLYDASAQVGGMNHFLLPERSGSAIAAASFGVNAMELLINDLMKLGAHRSGLRAKLFGGARMIAGLSDAGRKNCDFALAFLQQQEIPCVSQSLGGTQARRIEFWPDSGRARQRLLGEAFRIDPVPVPELRGGDVELF
ncbi:MAG: chemotaxis protein CheD [Thioclava marina]|jgi:Chemotaxis protein; stimulates methylation of MCP proteins|uniref:Probable chemoreceptor glutamine deamidase CheD n=1 Tax=Thioclava marina TaxID=1915077 RepID=A0ABX3MLW6_9RHOB|nr:MULTISPECIES: chemotaxis protein CheD [Thioclava]TNE90926.1 MAG: chemotaxis protein CheD [Paracoccaceae bacterium]MBC7144164.1 chemotaxis protein CheD [Thioclava marina]MBD3805048.1 chemotaxis protein CheD [Thioclava sp.]OOY12494.1 chemotaxis protein CheD [Thioclava marina]OOY28514.1 chemotaxis protein CheD [Thioclava sp. L04-15]